MRELDICGISRRRRKVFTTRADADALRAPDLVKRVSARIVRTRCG